MSAGNFVKYNPLRNKTVSSEEINIGNREV